MGNMYTKRVSSRWRRCGSSPGVRDVLLAQSRRLGGEEHSNKGGARSVCGTFSASREGLPLYLHI